MFLSDQLRACHAHLQAECAALPAPYPAYALFFSVTDGSRRAHVVHACGPDLDSAWARGVSGLRAWWRDAAPGAAPWLRIDWVEGARAVSWERLAEQLSLTRRNYFRLGLALDEGFHIAFTEQELNANAMLHGAADVAHAMVDIGNWRACARERFGAQVAAAIDIPTSGPVYLLSTRGVFCKADGVLHPLGGSGLNAGRREIVSPSADDVLDMVRNASSYLARQAEPDGAFRPGHFPCFDKAIDADARNDMLRHACALHAMVEAWELTGDPALAAAIERGLGHLCGAPMRSYSPDHEARRRSGRDDLRNEWLAFLVDADGEIHLGGSASGLLALVKYSEATGTSRWQPLMEKLACGILWMQHDDGRFDHVLDAGDLSPAQASSIDTCDAEAVLALTRLHGLTRNGRWLEAAEKSLGYLSDQERWRTHDHRLGDAVTALTRWRPNEEYFRFGLLNVADHLDFVLESKTTLPALLEFMLSASELCQRMALCPSSSHLLGMIDMAKLGRALEHRASYLLNGYFWPEMAMYFQNPGAIEGAFFVRDQSFRVRIDEVAQYLSAFVGYYRLLMATTVAPQTLRTAEPGVDAALAHRTVSA